MLAENAAKVREVGETDTLADLLDWRIARFQQKTGFPNAPGRNMLGYFAPRSFMEQSGQMVRRYMDEGRELLQRKLLVKMLIDPLHNVFRIMVCS